MPLTKELRARMARDMLVNRKFDGDTDIPAECRAFAGLAKMELIQRPAVDGWPYTIRLFTANHKKPCSPVHINLHGGGFLIGHMPNDDLWSAWLAEQIGGVVVDVDYTTTDQASHPVALDQCRDAARFTYAQCKAWDCDEKRISIGGYSAGGTLTMACGMAALKNNECPYCLLVNGYGPSDMRYDPQVMELPEYWISHRNDAFSVLLSDADPAVMELPELYPLGAKDDDLRGLPPTLILAADKCPFHEQNLTLGNRLADLGVEVTMKRYADTVHGFIPHFMAHWQEAAELIVKMINNTSL